MICWSSIVIYGGLLKLSVLKSANRDTRGPDVLRAVYAIYTSSHPTSAMETISVLQCHDRVGARRGLPPD